MTLEMLTTCHQEISPRSLSLNNPRSRPVTALRIILDRKPIEMDTASGQDELTILKRIDFEERRRAAARDVARAEYLEVMGAVVESLPDAFLIAGEKGEIILANVQTELIFGYHREQLICSHAADRGRYQFDPHLRARGRLREITGRRQDGTEVAIGIMLSPVVTRRSISTLPVIRRKRNG